MRHTVPAGTTDDAATSPTVVRIEDMPSPVGDLLVATDDVGVLVAVAWGECEDGLQADLRRRYGVSGARLSGMGKSAAVSALEAYFAGEPGAFEHLPLSTGGTDFQRSVWQELRAIPLGETISYRMLAERIGRPSAMRAVGLANGANPIPIVIPCHRVIGADGSLTGFGGGLDRKRWFLDHERAAGVREQPRLPL
ncbi:MAG: methylated-DNA--[protein]-cysteine S-methyltransferase [Sphingomonas sp.]